MISDQSPAAALLHRLLDSLERRANPGERAISVGTSVIPGYLNQNDPAVRLRANADLLEWERRGWVRLRWLRGERGNLLERIVLQAAAAPAIYSYLGRKPAGDELAELGELIARYRHDAPPEIIALLNDIETSLNAGRIPMPFQAGDHQRNEDLLGALLALSGLQDELAERDFSARVLGDSKRLAALKPALLSLARRAWPDLAGLSDEQAWHSLGVRPNPGHIFLHGPLIFQLGADIVRVAGFSPDLGLPVAALSKIAILELSAPYILTVENRTSFYDYIGAVPGNGLVVYLGGFPNRARRQLLRLLAAAAPEPPLYHWGDIDYGGLAILSYLRRALALPVRPFRMDATTLLANRALARPLTVTDRRNLDRLRADDQLQDCRTLIEAMLEHDIKLEQEALPLIALHTTRR